MPKPKATAEHDAAVLGDLMSEYEEPSDYQAEADTDIPAPKEELKLLAFRLPESERDEYKRWCVDHKMNMTKAFQMAFKLLKQKEGA